MNPGRGSAWNTSMTSWPEPPPPGSPLDPPVNSASQNLPQHLAALRLRMLHPTDFDQAVNYFLEEFAGDAGFMQASEPEEAPQLVTVVRIGVSKALGQKVELEQPFVSRLSGYGFFHGNARADGRIALFFYFQEDDTGIAMLIPGVHGEMEVARFRVKGGLQDSRSN
jgi:hypothetical protein